MPEALPDSTFGQYATAWAKRIRYGESGVLPVVAGLVVLVVIFQVQDSIFLFGRQHHQPAHPGHGLHPPRHGRGLGAGPR